MYSCFASILVLIGSLFLWERSASAADEEIAWHQLGAKAGEQYHGDALGVIAVEQGARLRCDFQKMEGTVNREGLSLTSTLSSPESEPLRVSATGLRHGSASGSQLPANGEVSVRDSVARWERMGLTEEYSVSVDGVRQDFIVTRRPQGDGPFRLELKVSGARAEASTYGVQLTLHGSNRVLAYSRLRVVDAEGRELKASLDAPTPDRLVVQVEDAHATYPLRIDPTFSDANWVTMNPNVPGASGIVNAVVTDGSGNLYIGGSFTGVGNAAANNIARWNGTTWSALGSGTNLSVNALVVQFGTTLFVGGSFSSAGGVANTKGVAQWDGTKWSALGTGVSGVVNSLAQDDNWNVYVGGQFTSAGGVANTTNIAQWNGNGGPIGTWSPLGTGTNNQVSALACSSGIVFAGGQFTSAGGVANTNHVARWDGTTWSAMGTGTNGNVNALATSGGSTVFVGGSFSSANGMANTSGIAFWSGNAWFTLGTGITGQVNALSVTGGTVYVGGLFAAAGGVPASNVAKWDSNAGAWSALGTGTSGTVTALSANQFIVYVGGFFSSAGGVTASNLATWNDNSLSWTSFGIGMDGPVTALAVSGTTVYVGGQFTSAGGVPHTSYLAQWNGSAWLPLGSGVSGWVNALAVNGSTLYVGGSFASAGGVANTNYIAKWDGAAWSALGTGMDNGVNALLFIGPTLYAGGDFALAGGVANTSHIAQWNGTAWAPLGTGANNSVNALVVHGTVLYIGGSFSSAGGVANTVDIARWDGSAWSALGTGMGGKVNALAVINSTLYAGGQFTTAGGVSAKNIAQWNGSAWSALGTGANSWVYALAVSGTNLYVGGTFSTAGGISASNIALWNGTSWSALGSGMNDIVKALAVSPSGPLYVGGQFTTAGTSVSAYVAKGNLGEPFATTLAASNITGANALVSGTMNANGGTATVSFDYGTTTAYGSSVQGSPASVTGSSDTTVSAALSGLLPGTVYHYRVTGVNGVGTENGMDRTFTTLNTVATLSALTLSTGTLSPNFDSGTLSYTASVSTNTTSITLLPTPTDSNARVTVNGFPVRAGNSSNPVNLGYGSNPIPVVVTASDNSTQVTYTVTVTRPFSTDASLSVFDLGVVLSPQFSSTTTAYSARVPFDIVSVSVTARATSQYATITVNGTTLFGTTSSPIPLNLGDNTITVQVTAQDTVTKRTYTTTLTRLPRGVGSQDTTFNSTGLVKTAFPGSTADGARGVALQGDGKIVVVGSATIQTSVMAVARYNADGTLDTGFGSNGTMTTTIGGSGSAAQAIAVQADGKLVIVGQQGLSNADSVSALVRLNSNGSVDNSFGSAGSVVTPVPNTTHGTAYAVALQTDGKMVVVSTVLNSSSLDDLVVARYNTNGSLDTSFGGSGVLVTEVANSYMFGLSVALQTDGRIVVGGYSISSSGGSLLMRYNSDGTSDTTFGGTGQVITPGVSGGYGVAVQSDGKILSAGFNSVSNQFVVTRYHADGSLDTGFGSAGSAAATVGALPQGASIALQSDGKILVGGMAEGRFALVRFNADGSLDLPFGAMGVIVAGSSITGPTIPSHYIGQNIAVQGDGNIIIVGGSNGADYNFVMMRFLGKSPTTPTVQGWRQAWFQTTDTTGIAGNTAAPAGDGICNLMKYALGLDPLVGANPSVLTRTINGSANPLFSDRLTISFTVPNPAPSDLTYAVQATSDLIHWTTVATKTGAGAWTWTQGGTPHWVQTDGIYSSTIQVGDMVPSSGNPQRMMRLQVSGP